MIGNTINPTSITFLSFCGKSTRFTLNTSPSRRNDSIPKGESAKRNWGRGDTERVPARLILPSHFPYLLFISHCEPIQEPKNLPQNKQMIKNKSHEKSDKE